MSERGARSIHAGLVMGLNVLQVIGGVPKTAKSLVKKTGLSQRVLYRAVRALVETGWAQKVGTRYRQIYGGNQ